jgi:hypothetical protein
MDDKIRILFHNRDAAGVNYFRTNTPAVQLERDHSDKLFIEINNDLDFNKPETIDYLKTFDIINYHRNMISGSANMLKLKNELAKAGVIMVMDIDDYWHLDKTHPFYFSSIQSKMHEEIIDNIKIADYVTTTTDLFAEEIRKITGKDNVMVYPNAVDPSWMVQFADNRKPDPDGLVRITYMAGSSHQNDIKQLDGVINRLNADPQTKGKFKIIVAGWDTQGTTTETKFNQEFGQELQQRGLWTREIIKSINKSMGNVDLIVGIPDDIRNKYRNNVFISNKRSIRPDESVYLQYERTLTDNHNIIENEEYVEWLHTFSKEDYDNEGNFARRWTKKANTYATVLDETDISIAPLADNKFNRMKSNLKQVECWSRKIAIVCSDIPPYNVDGVHEKNCMLVPNKKNAEKYWFKYLKRLIVDEELRNNIGQNLYDEFGVKYHLANVTNKRAEFYQTIAKKEVTA